MRANDKRSNHQVLLGKQAPILYSTGSPPRCSGGVLKGQGKPT